MAPSLTPTASPSMVPSMNPTSFPSFLPTKRPTKSKETRPPSPPPTPEPTPYPTPNPTRPPTRQTEYTEWLRSGSRLLKEDVIYSRGRRFMLKFQCDCNLVLYDLKNGSKKAVWASNSSRTFACENANFSNQGDGNLVIYTSNGPIWESSTRGKNCSLAVQDDGNLVLYCKRGVVW